VSVVKNDLEMKRLAKKRLAEIEEKNKVCGVVLLPYYFKEVLYCILNKPSFRSSCRRSWLR